VLSVHEFDFLLDEVVVAGGVKELEPSGRKLFDDVTDSSFYLDLLSFD